MRATIYISLILIACMNIGYIIYCRRVFPFFALIALAIVFMYFIAFADITILGIEFTLMALGGVWMLPLILFKLKIKDRYIVYVKLKLRIVRMDNIL